MSGASGRCSSTSTSPPSAARVATSASHCCAGAHRVGLVAQVHVRVDRVVDPEVVGPDHRVATAPVQRLAHGSTSSAVWHGCCGQVSSDCPTISDVRVMMPRPTPVARKRIGRTAGQGDGCTTHSSSSTPRPSTAPPRRCAGPCSPASSSRAPRCARSRSPRRWASRAAPSARRSGCWWPRAWSSGSPPRRGGGRPRPGRRARRHRRPAGARGGRGAGLADATDEAPRGGARGAGRVRRAGPTGAGTGPVTEAHLRLPPRAGRPHRQQPAASRPPRRCTARSGWPGRRRPAPRQHRRAGGAPPRAARRPRERRRRGGRRGDPGAPGRRRGVPPRGRHR